MRRHKMNSKGQVEEEQRKSWRQNGRRRIGHKGCKTRWKKRIIEQREIKKCGKNTTMKNLKNCIGSGCSKSLASEQLQSKTVEIISKQINKRMFPFTAHYFLAIRSLRKGKNAVSIEQERDGHTANRERMAKPTDFVAKFINILNAWVNYAISPALCLYLAGNIESIDA